MKTATLDDLASAAGVSRALVSTALSGNGRVSPQTKAKILQTAQQMGFQINPHAQRLAAGRSHKMIGLFSLVLDFGVLTHKIKLIQERLTERGYDVPLYAYGGTGDKDFKRQDELIGKLCRQRPRAILCGTLKLTERTMTELERYRAEGGIVICFDFPVDLDADQVIFERENNNHQTARHLLELGHRRLGLYMGGDKKPFGERLQGFTRALGEYGLKPDPRWMFNGGNDEGGGVLLAEQFMKLSKRPTGLCIVNDRTAAAFVNTLHRFGVRVPGDVSVVCHDDQPVARSSMVPLTSGIQPLEAIAGAVDEFLCSRLDGSYEGESRRKLVRGDLIVRASSAVPGASS